MSPNDTREERRIGGERDGGAVRTRLRQNAATGELDESLIEVLTWIMETDTRARIYLYLRQQPAATSDQIATGTGLYPSTVRETLAVLCEEGTVRRYTEELSEEGTDPYVYESIPPEELVLDTLEQIQDRLNTVFMLDELLGVSDDQEPSRIQRPDGSEQPQPETGDSSPISVTVTEAAFQTDDR